MQTQINHKHSQQNASATHMEQFHRF